MIVKNRIKEVRTQKNLTQNELANITGLKRYSISDWETGRTEPDIESLKIISRVLNVTLDYLLYNDEIENRQNSELTEEEQKELRLVKEFLIYKRGK